MYADGTGLLTYAMHDGRGAWSLPFPMHDGISGSGWLAFTQQWNGCVRESQLRGSGGVSPRFPSIPNRDKGFEVERSAVRCHAARKKGEIQV